jgi:hypothetical protein
MKKHPAPSMIDLGSLSGIPDGEIAVRVVSVLAQKPHDSWNQILTLGEVSGGNPPLTADDFRCKPGWFGIYRTTFFVTSEFIHTVTAFTKQIDPVPA